MALGLLRLPAQADQARRAGGSAADGHDATKALLFQRLFIQDLHLKAGFCRLGRQERGVGFWVEQVGGGID